MRLFNPDAEEGGDGKPKNGDTNEKDEIFWDGQWHAPGWSAPDGDKWLGIKAGGWKSNADKQADAAATAGNPEADKLIKGWVDQATFDDAPDPDEVKRGRGSGQSGRKIDYPAELEQVKKLVGGDVAAYWQKHGRWGKLADWDVANSVFEDGRTLRSVMDEYDTDHPMKSSEGELDAESQAEYDKSRLRNAAKILKKEHRLDDAAAEKLAKKYIAGDDMFPDKTTQRETKQMLDDVISESVVRPKAKRSDYSAVLRKGGKSQYQSQKQIAAEKIKKNMYGPPSPEVGTAGGEKETTKPPPGLQSDIYIDPGKIPPGVNSFIPPETTAERLRKLRGMGTA